MIGIDAKSLRGDWSMPTRIRFGPGRIGELPDVCAASGMRQPLLVTDPALAQHVVGHRAIEILRNAGLGVAVFADVRANPTGANVAAGVEAYRSGRHDGVIALGGGSALDAGKAIALMAAQDRPLWDFAYGGGDWRPAKAEAIAPVVAVPTTAGTGSEVGRASVITDEAARAKKIILHPGMLPRQVVADPELTLSLPPELTAWTGMDALSHSLEALSAPGFNPIADGIATEGIRLVHFWLERAVERGQDLAARAHLLAAASMGAIAFQKGLGAMHALAHPIGGLLDLHHGLTIAVVMPYVLARNRAAIEDRMAQLARTLGLAEPSFEALLERVVELRRTLGIPQDLAALGVREEHLATLAPRAASDPSAAGNPLPLREADYELLYREGLGGRPLG